MPQTFQNQSLRAGTLTMLGLNSANIHFRFIVVRCTMKDDGCTCGDLATSLNTMWLTQSLLDVHHGAGGRELGGHGSSGSSLWNQSVSRPRPCSRVAVTTGATNCVIWLSLWLFFKTLCFNEWEVCLSVSDCFSRCRRRAADSHWPPSLCLVTLSHHYSIMLLAQPVIWSLFSLSVILPKSC